MTNKRDHRRSAQEWRATPPAAHRRPMPVPASPGLMRWVVAGLAVWVGILIWSMT